MSRVFQALFVAGLLGAACSDTVPLNDPNEGGETGSGGTGGKNATGGDTSSSAGDAGAETGATSGMDANPMGGTGGSSGNGGTGGSPVGDAGSDGSNAGNSAAGTQGTGAGGEGGAGSDGYPPVCATSPDAPVVSGTRLKTMCTQATDGSQAVRRGRLYDSDLGIECYFHTAGDGSWRCLPFLETEGAPNAYSDSACQSRVLLVNPPPDGCPPTSPKYTHIGDQPPYCTAWTNDELHIHFFPVGAMINPINPLYAKSGADCVPANNGVSIGKMVYAIGAEVPVTTFVEGTRGHAP